MGRFEEIYRHSLDDVEGFWADAATAIDWDAPWERVLDDSRAPFYRWFAGGRLNSCYNALDRHVDRGRADQLALIYDSPVTGTAAAFTYRELRDEVARFAGALAAQGVQKGDRVVVYMPMVPEALIAMLACARIGAIHSVVFGGFAAPENRRAPGPTARPSRSWRQPQPRSPPDRPTSAGASRPTGP
jgi:propionyl-CoA synthetase